MKIKVVLHQSGTPEWKIFYPYRDDVEMTFCREAAAWEIHCQRGVEGCGRDAARKVWARMRAAFWRATVDGWE